MSDDKTPDPVPSPAPASTPSPEAQPKPEANPAPVAGGDKAAPPPASDSKAPAAAADDGIPSEDEVLARLTGGEQKKDTKPADAPAPKADAATAKPESEETPKAEGEKPEDEEAEDPNAEFVEPDEAELAGYHSKTRRRMKQVIGRLKEEAPFAGFARRHLAAAAEVGVDAKGVDAWLGLGRDLKAGAPEAVAALTGILASYGVKVGSSEPAPAPELDTSALKTVMARLKRDGHLNDAAEEDILAILPAVKAKEAAKPAPQAQPAPQPRQIPQQREPTPQERWQAAAAPVKTQVKTMIDGYAAGHGAKAPAIAKAIADEITAIESKLPQEQQFDIRLWESRARLAISRVHARLSVAPRPTVQPSLRGGTAPVPTKAPEVGTEAYEMSLLTGR